MSSACVSSISKNRLRSINDLREAGVSVAMNAEIEERYDIGVSAHVLNLVQDKDAPISDPVGRQYIPSNEELFIKHDEEFDPIGDELYSPTRGIVHRYSDRALFKVTSVCGVYCRYCFRREMIGVGAQHLSEDDFDAAISYIRSHSEIWEVILTGGDPFVLSPRKLQKVIDALEGIEHVRVIRIHSRIPIADPAKIDETILSVLKRSSKALQVVLHVNHRAEISSFVRTKILSLKAVNCTLYSQSVLLKGVNDDASVLENLFKELIVMGIKPYYLHHLDRAKGTSHFRVSIEEGKQIMRMLQGRISGIALPKYMLDIPGGHGKIPINDESVCKLEDGVYRVTDYQGCTHLYIENVEKQ